MERKQYEIILGQAHNIISSKVTDINALLTKPDHQDKYEEQVKSMARIMVKVYKEVFEGVDKEI
jgi:hypothetical protein